MGERGDLFDSARPVLGEEKEEDGEAWALGPLARVGGGGWGKSPSCQRRGHRLAVAGSEWWQGGLVSTWADKLAHITMC